MDAAPRGFHPSCGNVSPFMDSAIHSRRSACDGRCNVCSSQHSWIFGRRATRAAASSTLGPSEAVGMRTGARPKQLCMYDDFKGNFHSSKPEQPPGESQRELLGGPGRDSPGGSLGCILVWDLVGGPLGGVQSIKHIEATQLEKPDRSSMVSGSLS